VLGRLVVEGGLKSRCHVIGQLGKGRSVGVSVQHSGKFLHDLQQLDVISRGNEGTIGESGRILGVNQRG